MPSRSEPCPCRSGIRNVKLTALRDAVGISEADFEKAKAKLVDG